MADNPSLAVRLFGTDEEVEPQRRLTAGPLTAELDAGNLRYIRFNGVEMIRAISFIVRDRNWGTYNPQIGNLKISQNADSFRVTYEAVARDAKQEFRYSAEIVGRGDGGLRFAAKGTAVTDFLTNRTGFVVLHPIEGVAGQPAIIEQVDGERVETRFPDLIDPVQPMMNLRAITHSFAPGARVRCLMEGDAFEMEDQRNWTDASYKTYVRPLALPWPYTLAAGTEIEQSVTLSVEGQPPARAATTAVVSVALGARVGSVPPLGVGLEPEEAEAALSRAELLRLAHPAHVVCHYDPRRGHDRRSLDASVAVAKALGSDAWLEAVIAEVEGFEEEVAALGRMVKAMGSPFAAVLLSPAPDLKCTLPGSPWPPCPPLPDLYRAARRAFPGVRLGGGMFSYFTELNRKRPPAELLDFVSFTTTGLMHAGDDRSLMEGLESLPHVARSVRPIAGDKPYAVGPSAIGMRMNPYGAAPMENPNNIRQAMNRNDPRQRGIMGAAWHLGYFAGFAYGGASAISLGGAVGAHGIVHSPQPWPQPWFDDHGGLFPVYHVIRGLAGLAGGGLHEVRASTSRELAALAADTDHGVEIWLANLSNEPQQLALPAEARSAAVLDAESFEDASRNPKLLDVSQPIDGGRLGLSGYAVARVRIR